jgi:phosphoserine phosphatase RsbU/P
MHQLNTSRDQLERDLVGVAAMQRRILPKTLPCGQGAVFAAYYQASTYAGGDYYDVISLPDGQFGIIVADVSGHGISAAIVMAMIRAAVHAFPGFACDPSEMLRYLNRHFEFLRGSPIFFTALSALVSSTERSVAVACAGHPPPLLLHNGAVCSLAVNATMPVLMMMGSAAIPETTFVLESGDRLLFFTDGVTERLDPGDQMYDLPRLAATFERTGHLSPSDQIVAIVNDTEAFAEGRKSEDDQTLLLMEMV